MVRIRNHVPCTVRKPNLEGWMVEVCDDAFPAKDHLAQLNAQERGERLAERLRQPRHSRKRIANSGPVCLAPGPKLEMGLMAQIRCKTMFEIPPRQSRMI